MIALYYGRHTVALASHIALIEAEAPYSLVRVDVAGGEQRGADYLAVNKRGRLPSLVVDEGTLTETPAILAYIAQRFPAAGLAPVGDPFAFARVQAFNNYLCATLHVAHAHRMRGRRWTDDESAIVAMQRHVPRSVGGCFEAVEGEMLQGPWVMGETFTICDPYLFTVSQWLEGDGVDAAGLPRVMEHRRRMGERASVVRALAEEFA